MGFGQATEGLKSPGSLDYPGYESSEGPWCCFGHETQAAEVLLLGVAYFGYVYSADSL